jgi:hypothetical protein
MANHDRLPDWCRRWRNSSLLVEAIETNGKLIKGWTARTKVKQAELVKQVPAAAQTPVPGPVAAERIQRARASAAAARQPSPAPNGSGGDVTLSGPQQRILNSLATWIQIGEQAPTNAQVAWLAGYSPSSSSYANPRSALKNCRIDRIPLA